MLSNWLTVQVFSFVCSHCAFRNWCHQILKFHRLRTSVSWSVLWSQVNIQVKDIFFICIHSLSVELTAFSGLAAGMAIGIVGDAGVRAVGQQEKLFVGMILILIFAEALGLYGLIVALILSQQSFQCADVVA